jgi:hypothetical protein
MFDTLPMSVMLMEQNDKKQSNQIIASQTLNA